MNSHQKGVLMTVINIILAVCAVGNFAINLYNVIDNKAHKDE